MSLLLYINGHLADLEPGQVIAQTRQVNDLNSLDNRQASYTNKFSLPKTATNIKLLDYLTVTGNSSNVPYQKNTCSLYSHTGECFVYTGWAVITDGGDSYDCVVYDGIIDLYKAIENKTLADLNLIEINHIKDVATVKSTCDISNTLPYCYILADYNGNMGPAQSASVNIDYLIPSVRVSYLWEKVFSSYNIKCQGAIFNTPSFKNLWLTFPKSANAADGGTQLFVSNNYNLPTNTSDMASFWLNYNTADINVNGITTLSNRHLKVSESGYYRLEITGNLKITNDVVLYYAKNAEGITSSAAVPFPQLLLDVIHNNDGFEVSRTLYLSAQETVSFIVKKWGNPFTFKNDCELEIRLIKINTVIDFNEAFKSFSITDFLKEVIHRFGLTIFKDKYSANYRFLSMYELFTIPQTADWSSKFSKKISENYINGSYAQHNWFRYSYNDKEGSYNDGYLDVQNVNLPEAKDVIKSKIYSPEFKASSLLGRITNLYKFWEKEIGEDPETSEKIINYKPLDSRYYFMRAETVVQGITLYSDVLAAQDTVSSSWRENFSKLPFQDILSEYYLPIRQILEQAQIITADLWLTDVDIADLDFTKLYYIEQLSSYFSLNKINNYIPGKPTRCDLVRVQYSPPPPPDTNFVLTGITLTDLHQIAVSYTKMVQLSAHIEISYDGIFWEAYALSSSSPFVTAAMPQGLYYFRISYNGYSNMLSINVP